jgi:serine/threonine-protein kinase
MICPACSLENSAETEECFGCGKALFALTQGRVLADRYEIRRPLGQGGMGKVYEAYDRVLDDRVAVKVLRPQFAREPEMAKRFLLEIRLARRVTHPNVCRLHEYGESEGVRYLCMELVDGVNLKDVLRARRLATDEAYDVALAAAEGLAAVHAQGIIHRDFKTANIMVDARGQVKVMDFGIAKEVGVDTTGLSLAGHVLGTPEYMSPEQAQGGTVDFRSDLYALGCVIFELFAGRALFQGTSPIDTLRRQLNEPAVFDGDGGLLVPEALVPVLARALAKRPQERHPSVTALAEDVRAARAGRPGGDVASTSAGRRHAGIASAVVVAVLAVGAFAWWRHTQAPAPETIPAPSVSSAPPLTLDTPAPGAPTTSLAAEPSRPLATVPPRRTAPPPIEGAQDRGSPPATLLEASAPGPSSPAERPDAATASAPASAPPPTLSEQFGVLNLVVVPPSEVVVDGNPIGVVSSQALRLSPGRHALRVENPGYDPYVRVVTVRAGAATDFVLDLSERGVRKTP